MAQFKKEHQQKFWHSPIILIILFCVLALFLYNMVGLVSKERETAKKKALELDTIATLRARETSLSQGISKLNTDEGVEESIRDKYQVVKPGEKMVVIVDNKEPVSAVDEGPRDHTFWGFIKRMFSK